ncbi:MAG: ABC-ATPase domain-containing protein [Spirochaetaceae bacterium]
MNTSEDLREKLRRIDGRGYKAYKDIADRYRFESYTLSIDHVQGDPFASPSRVHIEVDARTAGFPSWSYVSPDDGRRGSRSREIATRDYITRRFAGAARRIAAGHRGTGKGGLIEIDRPGQEVLERSSAFIGGAGVEIRFFVGLPAFGRKVAGGHAEAMLLEEVPAIVAEAAFFAALDESELRRHVEGVEDADVLRSRLPELGLVAFVAEGAVLPRRSGIDQRPMAAGEAVAFESPPSLRVGVDLPNRGRVTGLGIREGVTLIVGGGYHGKSTLLSAVERGVYNHVPGDGRELVVSDPSAVGIRAEDGRRIEKTCITPFISGLPGGRNTDAFSSDDASGSTSQAANIIEALEVGAHVLLIDEDTSATNFMIRDHRMQELVHDRDEPITPFIDKVRVMHAELGVSTILVLGGSGDYFDVADCVIAMREYRPSDVTRQAWEIAARYPTDRRAEGGDTFGRRAQRAPDPRSIDPRKGKREVKLTPRGTSVLGFGTYTVDLSAVSQIVDPSQTRAIGWALARIAARADGRRSVADLVAEIEELVREQGLDALAGRPVSDLAAFRGLELAAALNRLRSLRVVTGA